jgi:hypothetical protein
MATGLNSDTYSETSYITVQEYKNAPTSIDYDNLVVGGNSAAQDAELKNVILRASSYMNEYFNQNLSASTYTETQRTRFTSEGYIALHPNNDPIIALKSFQYGTTPNNLITLTDPSIAWFEEQQLIIPLSNMATSYSSQGPLAFGGYGIPRQQLFVKYTYDSGYVNNPIATATVGQTSLIVQDATGILAGDIFRIYDGASTETVTVASNYTYGSTTVPLTSALVYSHASGVTLGNLPNAIKQACIMLATAFIKMRGDTSMTMGITTFASANITGNSRYGNEIQLALEICDKYRRVR